MSYIKGTMKCRICKKEYKYCWLYPDVIFESMPSKDEYVYALHNKQGDKYVVSAQCPCSQDINIVYYNEDGTLISE